MRGSRGGYGRPTRIRGPNRATGDYEAGMTMYFPEGRRPTRITRPTRATGDYEASMTVRLPKGSFAESFTWTVVSGIPIELSLYNRGFEER